MQEHPNSLLKVGCLLFIVGGLASALVTLAGLRSSSAPFSYRMVPVAFSISTAAGASTSRLLSSAAPSAHWHSRKLTASRTLRSFFIKIPPFVLLSTYL